MRSWDELTEKQIISVLSQFDSYCKAVIRNEARNLKRAEARRTNHEYLCAEPIDMQGTEDDYPSHDLKIETSAGTITIQSLAVFDSLATLPERSREALLLRYFARWSDAQIARHFDVVPRTIRKWRSRSLAQMCRMLEMEHPHAQADDPDSVRRYPP